MEHERDQHAAGVGHQPQCRRRRDRRRHRLAVLRPGTARSASGCPDAFRLPDVRGSRSRKPTTSTTRASRLASTFSSSDGGRRPTVSRSSSTRTATAPRGRNDRAADQQRLGIRGRGQRRDAAADQGVLLPLGRSDVPEPRAGRFGLRARRTDLVRDGRDHQRDPLRRGQRREGDQSQPGWNIGAARPPRRAQLRGVAVARSSRLPRATKGGKATRSSYPRFLCEPDRRRHGRRRRHAVTGRALYPRAGRYVEIAAPGGGGGPRRRPSRSGRSLPTRST